MKKSRAPQLLASVSLLLLACACSRDRQPADSWLAHELARSQLQRLPVLPQQVVMNDRQAPIPLVHSTCTAQVTQGIAPYQDVGWVGPIFFSVKSEARPHGYDLVELPQGRVRFTAYFRAPRSEAEAAELFRGEKREHERILFCDVGRTLDQLRDFGITRLAMWPTNGIRASIQLNREYEMALDLRQWDAAQEVVVSLEVEGADAHRLRQNLGGWFGANVKFDLSSQWRRSGCLQAVELGGVETTGLREGEKGAVSLAEIKQVVQHALAPSMNVDVTGNCGAYAVTAPVVPGDEARFLACQRLGRGLQCLYEGEFQAQSTVYTTYAAAGDM